MPFFYLFLFELSPIDLQLTSVFFSPQVCEFFMPRKYGNMVQAINLGDLQGGPLLGGSSQLVSS